MAFETFWIYYAINALLLNIKEGFVFKNIVLNLSVGTEKRKSPPPAPCEKHVRLKHYFRACQRLERQDKTFPTSMSDFTHLTQIGKKKHFSLFKKSLENLPHFKCFD